MIKVKQLEWEENKSRTGLTHRDLVYWIRIMSYVNYAFETRVGFGDDIYDYSTVLGGYSSMEEAKKSAQRHYEDLILSGIEVANDD